MDNQRVNRRRNLPAELKVEIVDCLTLENAVHFLANVPNRLIIHHCAPRVRHMLKMIDQIVADYASILTAANYDGYIDIELENGHKYTPEMDIFLRHGDAHCNGFYIRRAASGCGFVGYPANFFDDLIKHSYETKLPKKTVHHVGIELSSQSPAPWPAALLQTEEGEMNVEELEVYNAWKCVYYILRNKRNPGIAFKLDIFFERGAKCYQQMTRFVMLRVADVQPREE